MILVYVYVLAMKSSHISPINKIIRCASILFQQKYIIEIERIGIYDFTDLFCRLHNLFTAWMLDANPLDIIIRIIYECVKCFSRTINFDEKCTNSNLHRCLVHVGKDFSIQFARKKKIVWMRISASHSRYRYATECNTTINNTKGLYL